jgi:ubiquinone/menaquinone biosynthesis C-methylase UbiE
MNEINRIKEVYDARNKAPRVDYNPILPANNYFVISKEKLLLRFLYKYFGTDISSIKVLDVGFGGGGDILNLIKSGVNPRNIYGVEILEDRFNRMKEILPTTNLQLNEGFTLPFESQCMDLIIQSTVFSSILDFNSRKELASQMYRVLKPGGKIFSYDIRIFNPWNSNVTKMDKAEIKKLFPGARTFFYPVTFNPVLVRKIGKFSGLLCEILDKIPFLCSHYYTVIEKV